MVYFVYILECADHTLYVGSTNDLQKRLHAHNYLKSGARYTKSRRPVVLKYSESFRSRGKALRREGEIKNLTRQEKLDLLQSSDERKRKA
ncbi:MAG TPA: GIY-YIG nuclease family protein [Candidatus Paceibacterota bacterium]|nr:GIY-YIG nuclease family protein [Candidatus Paceibacterota bacterium]